MRGKMPCILWGLHRLHDSARSFHALPLAFIISHIHIFKYLDMFSRKSAKEKQP
jgi:hypothetical protein